MKVISVFSYAKNIDERKKMAEWLIEKKNFDMPLVLDSMSDGLFKGIQFMANSFIYYS